LFNGCCSLADKKLFNPNLGLMSSKRAVKFKHYFNPQPLRSKPIFESVKNEYKVFLPRDILGSI